MIHIREFLHYFPAMYAPELCDDESVAKAREYFAKHGGVLYERMANRIRMSKFLAGRG
jgi:hypothetical protein